MRQKIKAGGWWKFKHDKIENSPADLWILVLYRFSHRDFDFVIIEPGQLLEIYNKLDRAFDNILSYLWVTECGKCWETRGLGKSEQESIVAGTFNDTDRDLSSFLNNWQPLTKKIDI